MVLEPAGHSSLTLSTADSTPFPAAFETPNAPSTTHGDAGRWRVARVWAVAFGLATIASLYFVLQSWLLDMQANGRLVSPSRETFAGAFTWFVWALLAPAMVSFFRSHPVDRQWSARVVGVYALASVVAALAHGAIENPLWFWAVHAPPVAHYNAAVRVVWWTLLRSPTSAMQFLAFAAAYHALALARSARERELTASRAQAALAEAELRVLKMRLEPHFLFNTLNAILSYVRHDPRVAEEMIGRLGRLLRGVLQSSGNAEVPLSQEIALVGEYLELHRVRFGDRLTIAVTIESTATTALIPSMLLQPIVENAIQHGIATRPGAGEVSISACRENSVLVVEVRDTAGSHAGSASEPMQRSANDSDGSGVGLAVTRARLAQLYGSAQQLTLSSSPSGTTVRIELPFHTPNARASA